MVDFTKKEEFSEKYFRRRWDTYLGYISKSAKKIIYEYNLSNFLEIGCAGIPLIKNSDTIDINPTWEGTKVSNSYPTFLYDISKKGWPIKDKYYDLSIATQVWEHLDDPYIAFEELKRVSKYAILTFPYLWKVSDEIHNNITKEKIDKWTLNTPFLEEKIFNTHKKRLMRIYKF
ncbi:MAG: methyltransferase domain-containing protein [bacterium]